MSKIVIEARESGTSTGRHIDKLIENLHKLNPDLEILILTKAHRVDFFKQIAPNFEVRESNYKEFSFGEQLGLARQLYSLKPDLVHFTMPHQPVLYFGKSITTIHDLTTARFRNPAKNFFVFKFKQWVYRGVLLWVARKSKAILTISQFVKQDIANYCHINPKKITVTYLAADKITESPLPIYQLQSTDYLLYVGRPLPHKNLRRLIDAHKILIQTHPQLILVVAGKKDVLYERLELYAKKQGLEKSIDFTGFISEGQLRWLYENTAAYVFPSLSEGFGLPGLEAMVHGAPVVSSNATCLPEIYGDAALYFNPEDVADMASKISQLLDDKQLRSELVAKGKAQAAKYSWAKMAAQTLEVYKQTLGH